MKTEMPSWLKDEYHKYEGEMSGYTNCFMGFKKCYELMTEKQKPQPIETAPRDGTEILIFEEFNGRFVQGYYNKIAQEFQDYNDECIDLAIKWLPLPETDRL